MYLEEFLSQNQTTILQRWFDLLADIYPPETAKFLKEEKDQFANPVGYGIQKGLEGLYQELAREMKPARVRPWLDKIIRIRAVQDLSPSQAIAFIFLLKKVLREELAEDIRENRVAVEELLALESRIDCLALLSLDVYMECREKVYEIRVNEVKNRTYRLLQRANLLAE